MRVFETQGVYGARHETAWCETWEGLSEVELVEAGLRGLGMAYVHVEFMDGVLAAGTLKASNFGL